MPSFVTISNHLDDYIRTNVINKCIQVPAGDLGLNSRCGNCWVDPESNIIVVPAAYISTFEYYGGFEFVPQDHKIVAGHYTVFSGENAIINAPIEYFRLTQNLTVD